MANFVFYSDAFPNGIQMGTQDFDFVTGNGSGTFDSDSLEFVDGTNSAIITGEGFEPVVIFGLLAGLNAGTIHGLHAEASGQNVLDVTGWNLDAPTIFADVRAGDWPTLWNDLLIGNDTVNGTTHNDNLLGAAGRDSLVGDRGRDVLSGGAGNDTLVGGIGHDRLIGNGGADRFVFAAPINAAHSDRIVNFVTEVDKIALDHSFFTELQLGDLSGSRFVQGTQAGDENDRIIYDRSTGQLFYDADGSLSGSDQVLIANLGANTTLSNDDFLIIA